MEGLFGFIFNTLSSLINFGLSSAQQDKASELAYDNSFYGQLDKWTRGRDVNLKRLAELYGTDSDIYREYAASTDYKGNYMAGVTGTRLTNAQREQNEWNAGQAQDQRNWLQYMYEHRNQMAVDDMSAAGLNPAMMYGGVQSPASVPSGAAASGGSPGNPAAMDAAPGAIGSIMSGMANSYLAFSQARLMQAQTREVNAKAQNVEITNMSQDDLNRAQLRLWQSEGDLNSTKIGEVLQNIRTGAADEALKMAGVDRTEAETDLVYLQAISQHIDNQNKQELIDLQKQLTSSEIAVNSQRYNEIRASIGKIYAETLTEAYKQGALSAEAAKDLETIGLIGSQKEGVDIDNKYRNLSNKVDIAVKITEGFKNTAAGASDINDIVTDWVPAPGKLLGKILRGSGRGRQSSLPLR